MVKLYEQDSNPCHQELKLKEAVIADGQTKNGLSPQTTTTEMKTIDLDLVRQLRQSLRREYEENNKINLAANSGSKQVKYSAIHYGHLMDEKHPETCWRYLLQTQLNVDQALELAKKVLAWREEFQIDLLRPEDLVKEFYLKTPIGFTGKTLAGQDLVYAMARNYKKPDDAPLARPVIKQFITTVLFDWDRKHQHDLEKMVLVFDTTQSTFRNIDLDFSTWLISIQDYVPSRFEAIYIVGIPFLLRPIIRLIISWLPDKYRQICYCCNWESLFRAEGAPKGLQLLDQDQVPSEAGGTAPDSWRLVPKELQVPWASEKRAHKYSEELLEKVDTAICFNTSPERLAQLVQMQRDYDAMASNG